MAIMRQVRCHNCGLTTRHQIPILEQIVLLQSVSSEAGLYINYACPGCSTLTRSHVEPEAEIFEGVDLEKFPDDLTLYVVFLECAKTGCESPVILLAPVPSGPSLLTEIQTSWTNRGALCAKHFAPLHPYLVRYWKKLAP